MRRLVLTSLVSLIVIQPIFCQPTNIDSLKNVLKGLPNDTSKVSIMEMLIYELSYGSKDEALQYAGQAMKISQSLDYEEGVANVNDLYGIIYLDKGVLDSAQQYFLKALTFYEEKQESEKIFKSYQKLGQVHAYRNSFEQAKEYYDKAFEMAKTIDDPKLLGNAYNAYGTFYINQGWHLLDNQNDTINYITHFNTSMPYIYKAIEKFKEAGYDKGVALAYANLAILYEVMDDLEASLQHMRMAERFFEKMEYKIYLVSAYNHFNKVYQSREMYDSALFYVNKSLVLAEELDSKFDLRNAYGQLSYIYEELGDLKKSIEYHRLYDDVDSQILDEKKQALIDELEVKYESDKQNQALIIEKTKSQTQQLVIICVLTIAGGLIALTVFLWKKNKNEKQLNLMLGKQKEELMSKNEEIASQRDQLQQKNAQLEEAYQVQNNLMAVVAHDLRSPLNKVKGLNEVLRLSGDLNDQQLEVSVKTSEVADSGLDLIADILKLSTYKNGIETKIEPIGIDDFLNSVVESHASYAIRKDIEIIYNEISSVTIESDKIFLTRILDNIISNAVKFSPTGSTVEISGEVKKERLILRVKDYGPGMSDDDLKNVFKHFKPLSAQPTGGEKSTGLGLAIVKTLVEKLDGTVAIETIYGKGTTFIIELPMS